LRAVDGQQFRAGALLPGRAQLLGLRHTRYVLGPGATACLGGEHPEDERGDDPRIPDVVSTDGEREPDAEDDRAARSDPDARVADLHDRPHADGAVGRVGLANGDDQDPEEDDSRDVRECAQDVQRKDPVVEAHATVDPMTMESVESTSRHLRLLTETIAAVNSSLDLQEVLELVASKVADALGTDACFVYLYDERADELVLRATHGTRVEELTRTPRMRPGEGITGVAAAERAPVMIAEQAHLDPRFKQFPNLPEDEYQSILAVPILARETLEGALNVRTREPRAFTDAEIELLVAIAAQVAQTIEHAKLYERAQRRVAELEALARISEAVSESLYLEESLEAIVKTTMESLHATGAALVLEDGKIAWPEGRAGAHNVRLPLRWKRRQIGELVCDRDMPFSPDDEALLEAIAHHAAVALEHGRAVMRGVLAQEIHHRVKNNLQSVASLLRLQARAEHVDARKSLSDSVNRILAIAAVHEVLTEHREDDVDLGELVDRLRAMLVQGLVAGKDVSAELEPVSLAGQRATALALVFTELFQNALEHGGDHVSIALAQRNGEVVLTIADDGAGFDGEPTGTGLSIVRALVRDELRGELALESAGGGLRAEVVFPG
jgi:two-component sensor histidine kinase/putative methionine-R-sulfoxide reductase with GAF domain